METLILVFDAPAPSEAELADTLSDVASVRVGDRQIVLERGDSRVYFRTLENIDSDILFDWPAGLAPSHPTAFALDYRDADLAQKVVCALAARSQFLIDTNFGTVVTSAEFCNRSMDDIANWRVKR